MKNEILNILKSNAEEGWNGDVLAVGDVDFDTVVEQINNLVISNIKGRENLLMDGIKRAYLQGSLDGNANASPEMIEEYKELAEKFAEKFETY